ncbi:MAG: hypothetical protein LKF37_10225 [Lentilactobacillus diolivorans]|nr:hypothetical protein [Lentilactobacillus diolivorans]
MVKSTQVGRDALDALLEEYKDQPSIPEEERLKVLKQLWPNMGLSKQELIRVKIDSYIGQGLNDFKIITNLYKDGFAVNLIAQELQIPKSNIFAMLHSQGLAQRRNNIYYDKIEPNLERIRSLIIAGYTRVQIADELGLSHSSITDARKTYPVFAKLLREADEMKKVSKTK